GVISCFRASSPVVLLASRPTRTATPSLHAALPISAPPARGHAAASPELQRAVALAAARGLPAPLTGDDGQVAGARHLDEHRAVRSEEHTSEFQSRENLVCRLLLEKKKAAADRRRP